MSTPRHPSEGAGTPHTPPQSSRTPGLRCDSHTLPPVSSDPTPPRCTLSLRCKIHVPSRSTGRSVLFPTFAPGSDRLLSRPRERSTRLGPYSGVKRHGAESAPDSENGWRDNTPQSPTYPSVDSGSSTTGMFLPLGTTTQRDPATRVARP